MIQVPLRWRKSLSAKLEEALKWAESLGISLQGSRFVKYAQDLKLSEGHLYLPIRFQLDSSDSAIEASDLVLIRKGLCKQNDPEFKKKLLTFLRGPIHSSDEKALGSSHKARDTALELVIGAHFALAGFAVRFDTQADVVASDDHTVFYVECKRPSSRNVAATIDEIYHQLKRRYSAHKLDIPPRGLAVISLNKIINPESLPLRVRNAQEALSTIESVIKGSLNEQEKLWYSNLDDRTMGVIAYVSIAVSFPHRRGLLILRQFGAKYVSLTHDRDIAKRDPDRVYFKQIMSKLSEGTLRAFSANAS